MEYFGAKSNNNYTNGLITKNLRLNLVKKVYGILSIQLLSTVLFCYFSLTSTYFKKFQAKHQELIVISLGGTLISSLILSFSQTLSRKVPVNYILLGIFTLCESYLVSISCLYTSPKLVLMAGLLTLAVTLGLTVYAMTTKNDFSIMTSGIFVLLISFTFLGIINCFTNIQALQNLGMVLGVIVYGFYLIFDTQMIIGGKRCNISIDDYILASMMLYIDIISLFIKILEILKHFQTEEESNKKRK